MNLTNKLMKILEITFMFFAIIFFCICALVGGILELVHPAKCPNCDLKLVNLGYNRLECLVCYYRVPYGI